VLIELQNVQRFLGSRAVLDGVSMRVNKSSRVGVVGPNGAGKTTMLKLLGGIDAPDGGEISRARGLRIGMLPQEVATLGDGSVLELVIQGQEELMDVERQMAALQKRLEEDGDLPRKDLEHLGTLQDQFSVLGGYEIEGKALRILAGLGFTDAMSQGSISELSGGWMMRVVIARLLLRAPDLLLLDEPTNHLDLPSLEWFETFLESYQGAVVLISHDRTFLAGFCNEVVELNQGKLERYVGNYAEYLGNRALRRAQQVREQDKQQARIAELESFVERFKAKATKAKQAQSRVKMLQRMDKIEVGTDMKKMRGFRFPAPVRTGDKVVEIKTGLAGYGELEVLKDVDLLVRRGQRVALVGPNGGGKSTLLNIIAGKLSLLGGDYRLGAQVSVGYFAQHLVRDLNTNISVLDSGFEVSGGATVSEMRGILGAFLFSGDDVNKKVGVLSGGEKARLALARLLLKPAPLLILDEPTNHLDITSRKALEDALSIFTGTLIFVSHDRSFVSQLATTVVEVGEGKIERFEGDFDSYLGQREARKAALSGDHSKKEAVPKKVEEPVDQRSAKERRREAAEVRAQLAPMRKEKRDVERKTSELEVRIKELDAQLALPETYNDPCFPDLVKERSQKADRLDWCIERWAELEEELEKLEAKSSGS
jgi:ATP-binding cassette subfamily F protein 3